MFCKYCGTQLDDGSAFCTKCGRAQGETKKTTTANPVPQNNNSSSSSSSYNMLCIAGFTCSVVALFFSGVVFSIVGLILSSIGKKDAIRNKERGAELATVGIVISTILLIVSVIALVSGVAVTAGLFSYLLSFLYY